MKIHYFILSLLILPLQVIAQKSEDKSYQRAEIKGHMLGGALNMTDYTASFKGFTSAVPGLSLLYNKGLLRNIDFSARVNVSASSYNKVANTSLNRIIAELQTDLYLKAFSNSKTFNPLAIAGIGIGNYSKSYALYVPLGAGLEINPAPKLCILVQAQYRVSLSKSLLDNNMFYSVGILTDIGKRKKRGKEDKRTETKEPRIDTDKDGIADSKDDCPTIPGLPRFKGCPDTDGDGIPDKRDACPDVAGIVKYKGCPIPDRDKDGVNDEQDKCPDVAGTVKRGGCPAPDTDGDGIDDDTDKCPNMKGPISNQGCPEVAAEVKAKLQFAATAILFSVERAEIQEQSFALLDEIVAILQEYNDYNLHIDGHTDSSGNSKKNLKLSKQRAEAVAKYFVDKGILKERIIVNWHGDTKPKVSNELPEGRIENRRVELDLRMKE